MKKSSSEATAHATVAAAEKRVVLSMGGKGGVGKTSVMTGLAEWFDSNQIPLQLMDLIRRTRRADPWRTFLEHARRRSTSTHPPGWMPLSINSATAHP